MEYLPLILTVVFLIAWARLFSKAGKPGWGIIVPIYNVVLLFQIAGVSMYWMACLIVGGVIFPFAPDSGGVFLLTCWLLSILYVHVSVSVKTAKNFGQGIGVQLLSIFGLVILITAFGNAKFVGVPKGKDSADVRAFLVVLLLAFSIDQ